MRALRSERGSDSHAARKWKSQAGTPGRLTRVLNQHPLPFPRTHTPNHTVQSMHAKSGQTDPQKQDRRYPQPHSQTRRARPPTGTKRALRPHSHISNHKLGNPRTDPPTPPDPTRGFPLAWGHFRSRTPAHLVSRGPNAGRSQKQKKEAKKWERWAQCTGARPGPRCAPAAAGALPERPRVGSHGCPAAAGAASPPPLPKASSRLAQAPQRPRPHFAV